MPGKLRHRWFSDFKSDPYCDVFYQFKNRIWDFLLFPFAFLCADVTDIIGELVCMPR